MSRKIFWYEIPTLKMDEDSNVKGMLLPIGAQIINVGMRQGQPVLWAAVDPDEEEKMIRTIFYVGTGWELPEGKLRSLGLMVDDPFFWHVLELSKASGSCGGNKS